MSRPVFWRHPSPDVRPVMVSCPICAWSVELAYCGRRFNVSGIGSVLRHMRTVHSTNTLESVAVAFAVGAACASARALGEGRTR